MEMEQMTEQMMERLLTKVAAMQEKVVSHHEKMDTTLREMTADQELLKEEMLAKLDAHHERKMARMDSQLEKMKACLGKMEATDLEANPEERVLVGASRTISLCTCTCVHVAQRRGHKHVHVYTCV
jgi:hypothetical protein